MKKVIIFTIMLLLLSATAIAIPVAESYIFPVNPIPGDYLYGYCEADVEGNVTFEFDWNRNSLAMMSSTLKNTSAEVQLLSTVEYYGTKEGDQWTFNCRAINDQGEASEWASSNIVTVSLYAEENETEEVIFEEVPEEIDSRVISEQTKALILFAGLGILLVAKHFDSKKKKKKLTKIRFKRLR